MVDGDDSFKRPGAVPFTWEVRAGVPKIQNHRPDDYPTLLQTPKKLAPLRLKPLPPSNKLSPSFSSSFNSDSKTRPPSPFAPPSFVRFISSPDSQSHSSRPPAPYFRSFFPQAGGFESGVVLPRCFPKSLIPSSSESDKFYESETTFSPSEDSSHGSDSTRWGTPKSSFSYLRDSPLKRNDSELSPYDKKNHCNYGSVSAQLAIKHLRNS